MRRPSFFPIVRCCLILTLVGCGTTPLPIGTQPFDASVMGDAGDANVDGGDGAVDGGDGGDGAVDGGDGAVDAGDGAVDGGDGGMTGCLVPSDCDDGLPCNGVEVCDAGVCKAGTPITCPSDGVACTVEACVDATGKCTSTPNAALCAAGQVCDPATGCGGMSCSGDAQCDDGVFCNGPEKCIGGACKAGTNVVCTDGIDCTVDACDEASKACVFRTNDAFCNDGLFCNGMERCTATGCATSPALSCDDTNACTTDVCSEPAGGCTHFPRDSDGDGAGSASCGGTDCNDSNPAVNPEAMENCTNGIDDNCNGLADCGDSACKTNPACIMCVPVRESCLNFRDDDCDGLVDCADRADCGSNAICRLCLPREFACFPLPFPIDTDCDNLPGCSDPDCAGSTFCVASPPFIPGFPAIPGLPPIGGFSATSSSSSPTPLPFTPAN